MVNARAKGQRYERKAAIQLKDDGYAVEIARPDRRPIGPGRWVTKAHDFFGVFDLLAVGDGGKVRLIQIHAGHEPLPRMRAIEEFVQTYGSSTMDFQAEMWLAKPRRGWRKQVCVFDAAGHRIFWLTLEEPAEQTSARSAPPARVSKSSTHTKDGLTKSHVLTGVRSSADVPAKAGTEPCGRSTTVEVYYNE